jgi:hypothetical protein
MKRHIDLHKRRLYDLNLSIIERREYVSKVNARINELMEKASHIAAQIATAERRGITAFDGDRFLKAKKGAK